MILHIDVQFQVDRRPTTVELSGIERNIRRMINRFENLVVNDVEVEFY